MKKINCNIEKIDKWIWWLYVSLSKMVISLYYFVLIGNFFVILLIFSSLWRKSTSTSYELKKKENVFNFSSSHVKVQKRDVIYMSTFLWCGLDFLRLNLWAENVISYILGLRDKVFHMYQITFSLIAMLDFWN